MHIVTKIWDFVNINLTIFILYKAIKAYNCLLIKINFSELGKF